MRMDTGGVLSKVTRSAFDHVKMDAAFAKGRTLVRGRSGQAEYSVVTALNKGPNAAESHDLDTDATYVTDGKRYDSYRRHSSCAEDYPPGETRAQSIQGGEARSSIRVIRFLFSDILLFSKLSTVIASNS